jgi:hypothetical protein
MGFSLQCQSPDGPYVVNTVQGPLVTCLGPEASQWGCCANHPVGGCFCVLLGVEVGFFVL